MLEINLDDDWFDDDQLDDWDDYDCQMGPELQCPAAGSEECDLECPVRKLIPK